MTVGIVGHLPCAFRYYGTTIFFIVKVPDLPRLDEAISRKGISREAICRMPADKSGG